MDIEEQRIEKEKKRGKQRDAEIMRKHVENQKQEIARQSIEKHEENTRKTKDMEKTNHILSKWRMLKITENRRSKIRNISNTTPNINTLIKITRKIMEFDNKTESHAKEKRNNDEKELYYFKLFATQNYA